ncbi:CDP-glycerol glycerophosphotransferase family protein [Bacillus alkalisoli]|uniref:CDP-glycerol glycerophosphotransferase family protein n=1 Tax=Bacillus alkalisoli TaxID=2011008 RepID=UPI000C23609D|nr:CDP-glycerol glycerophosphotransferase family protein [Bacillus alkalisoli]
MYREVVLNCYLHLFKIFFDIFKLFPLQKKLTFVVSYTENCNYLIKEIRKQSLEYKVILLCKPLTYEFFSNEYPELKVRRFETFNLVHWFNSIYHLSTSKHIIIDNYYGFLSSINFRKSVECIQIWHAVGSFKQFGLKDRSNYKRSKSAIKRFKRVYSKFHKIVVGSEKMANIFKESFGIQEQNILRTGIPRTDFFYDNCLMNHVRNEIYLKYPNLKEKKVITYAPTFRKQQLKEHQLELEIEKLYNELSLSNFILIIKLHPMIRKNITIEEKYKNFIYDFSDYNSTNELLLITDYLITDYSSLPCEFSILNKPIIFFVYDLEEYKITQGLIEGYMDNIPFPVVYKTEQIIKIIKQNEFKENKTKQFSLSWNEYSIGNSSENLIKYIKKNN